MIQENVLPYSRDVSGQNCEPIKSRFKTIYAASFSQLQRNYKILLSLKVL